jgi:hypothetical protein
VSLPFTEHFDAALPGVAGTIRIASLQDAQVFARRWVIRDRDRALKTVLRKLERANGSDSGYAALADFKRALMARGLFPGETARPATTLPF